MIAMNPFIILTLKKFSLNIKTCPIKIIRRRNNSKLPNKERTNIWWNGIYEITGSEDQGSLE